MEGAFHKHMPNSLLSCFIKKSSTESSIESLLNRPVAAFKDIF